MPAGSRAHCVMVKAQQATEEKSADSAARSMMGMKGAGGALEQDKVVIYV